MPKARKKLGIYIIAAFFLNIFAIMSVGAMCIMLVGNMLNNIQEIRTESDHVFKSDTISNKVHKITDSINKAVITGDRSHLQYAGDIIVDAVDETNTFITKKEWRPEDKGEHDQLRNILSLLLKIRDTINELLADSTTPDSFDPVKIRKLEKLSSNIQIISEKLRDLHSPILASLVDDSYHKMRFILLLYLLSSFIGILASIVAYMVLTRNTITPIIHLARATKEVASGDLSVRVDTDSSTEIGALFKSFNTMTERLEGHAREREEFSRELERIVEERTKELRDANQTLREAQSELVRMEKIATMGQIAASVNHEIKTPLNSLYLNLQLLTRKINKQEWPDDNARSNLLDVTVTIDKEILRISEILEEFVQYARFAPPKTEEEDINSIVNELAVMIGESAKEANVDLRLELYPDHLSAKLDRKKITQALLNLCVNAIHAMPKGGSLLIKSEKSAENNAVMTIKDTGTGIEKADLDKIFEPFFTKKEKGMGFGLPIVKRIIEDHKGTLSCSSIIGEGTEFIITVPSSPEELK